MIEIVSIHIPKTAGRSFLEILNSVYDPKVIAHFDRKNFSGRNISDVKQFCSDLSKNIKVIHGHFRYDELSDIENIKSAKVITWLRDPVERVVSNYSFFKKRISESWNEDELQKRKLETLIEYASMENSRNRMSKFIDGLPIKNFFFIGITEYFDSNVKHLGELLNWKPFQIPRINDNSGFKSTLPKVSEDEKKIIADLNQKDIELYRMILDMQDKKII